MAGRSRLLLLVLKVSVLRNLYGPIAMLFLKAPQASVEESGEDVSADQWTSVNRQTKAAESLGVVRSKWSEALWELSDSIMMFCIGLPLFNMIPIAPFDGGVMLVRTVEAIFGPGWIVNFVTIFGLMLFVALLLFITVQDIVRVWKSRRQ